MVKDYAKKTYTPKRKTKKPSHHVGLYLFIVLLLCLFFTGLYYKKMQPIAIKKTIVPKEEVSVKQISVKPPSPSFEFYTLLPKVKNTFNKTNIPINNPKQIPENYFLQVTALYHQEDADAMKAKLLLLGFDVNIKTQNIKGETGYRVNIGPYSTLSALRSDQNRLQQNNINTHSISSIRSY